MWIENHGNPISVYTRILVQQELDLPLDGGLPVFKQSIGGSVEVLNSPYVSQQNGLYKPLLSCTAFSCMVARDIPLHGKLSLQAKYTGFFV